MSLDMAGMTATLATTVCMNGWTIEVLEHPAEGPFLRVSAVEPNYRNPSSGKPSYLSIDSPIPPLKDADAFDRFVAWRLARIGAHETLEAFQRCGVPVVDPHGDTYWPRSPQRVW